MLPTKQYFHISGFVPSSKLHQVMSQLEDAGAYNVEIKAYNQLNEKPKGTRSDLTEVRQNIVGYLNKYKKPIKGSELLKAVGAPGNYGLLSAMVKEKAIKKVKAGVYKI